MGDGAIIKIVGVQVLVEEPALHSVVYLSKSHDGTKDFMVPLLRKAYSHLKNNLGGVHYASGAENYADLFAFQVINQYRLKCEEWSKRDGMKHNWEYEFHLQEDFNQVPTWYKRYRVNLLAKQIVFSNGRTTPLEV